jgi:replicative DNA helicase
MQKLIDNIIRDDEEMESKLLKCLFFDKELFIRSLSHGSLPSKVFADKSHQTIFSLIQNNFNRQGQLPNIEILKAQINRLSVKVKDQAKVRNGFITVAR